MVVLGGGRFLVSEVPLWAPTGAMRRGARGYWPVMGYLVSLSLRLKDLLGPVTRVKKKYRE